MKRSRSVVEKETNLNDYIGLMDMTLKPSLIWNSWSICECPQTGDGGRVLPSAFLEEIAVRYIHFVIFHIER